MTDWLVHAFAPQFEHDELQGYDYVGAVTPSSIPVLGPGSAVFTASPLTNPSKTAVHTVVVVTHQGREAWCGVISKRTWRSGADLVIEAIEGEYDVEVP